jgi:hypothetical protein
MPQILKAQDTQTGEVVEFEWLDPTPPTDKDLEEVFTAHRARKTTPPPTPQAPSQSEHKGWFGLAPTGIVPDEDSTGIVAVDAYKKLFSREGLPGTMGTLVGGALTASGVGVPLAIPVGAAVAGGTEKLLGGSNEDAMKAAAWDAAGNAVGFGLPKVLGSIGRYGVRSALKKGSATPNQIDDLVQTSIYEGITPSRHGFNEADQLVTDLTGKVKEIVSSLPQAKTAVDVERALREIAAVKQDFLARGALDSDIRVLDDVATQYLNRYGKTLSPNRAQELKTGLMERADAKGVYEQSLNPAVGEAQGAFASGLRKQIEELTAAAGNPVDKFNQRAGKLIALRDAMVTNEPNVHPAAAVATTLGGPKVGAIQIGMRPAVQAAVGRRVARVAQAFDPKYMGVAAPEYPQPKQNLSMDQLGIPEIQGVRWEPDALDAVGVPVERGARDIDAAWLQRFAQEPQIQHQFPNTPRVTLDQFGIEEIPGPAYQADALSALDIPATRDMYTPEDLWMMKHYPGDFEWWSQLHPAQKRELFQKGIAIPQDVATQSAPPDLAPRQPRRITAGEVGPLYKKYLEQK